MSRIVTRDRQHRTVTFAYCNNCSARHCRYLRCFPQYRRGHVITIRRLTFH